MSLISLELRSEITPAGQLRLGLEEREVATPGPDEVVVRVEAAPINPADLAVLIGPAALATLSSEGTAGRPVTSATVPDRLLRLISGACGQVATRSRSRWASSGQQAQPDLVTAALRDFLGGP